MPSPLPEDDPILGKLHRARLTRDELRRLRCAAPTHLDAVRAFAERHGLQVVGHSDLRGDVQLRGTVGRIEQAFDVELCEFTHEGRTFHAHEGDITVPDALDEAVEAVIGLSAVPIGRPLVQAGASLTDSDARTPAALAERYRFPGTDTTGARVAVLEFGGGYHDSDLEPFFSQLGLTRPPIEDHRVSDGATLADNDPLDTETLRAIAEAVDAGKTLAELGETWSSAELGDFVATLEATMDTQLAGGAAVDVYFAPPTAEAWRRAIYAAIGEPMDSSTETGGEADVISISWGMDEVRCSTLLRNAIARALEDAELLGITVCCSSGDSGPNNRGASTGEGLADVNFPASCPSTLAVGGTMVVDGVEQVWKSDYLGVRHASGGGMSGAFDPAAH